MESVCDYQQQIATEYFLAMCKSDRLLEVYYCYDCKGHIRLVAQLLRRIEAPKRHLLISGILDTLLKHWRQTAFNYENRSRGLIRSFNH